MTKESCYGLFALTAVCASYAPLLTHAQPSQPPAELIREVLQLLPSHSALPPDLSTAVVPNLNETVGRQVKGIQGGREPLVDPGLGSGYSLQTTFIESAPSSAIPAQNCRLIVYGKVVSGYATLSYNKLMVYSTYDVDVKTVYKQAPKEVKPTHIQATLFGGGIHFRSGNLMYCVVAHSGFMNVGQHLLYFLFKSVKPYSVAALYLDEGSKVYPMLYDQSTVEFEAMPTAQFELELTSAVAKNVNR